MPEELILKEKVKAYLKTVSASKRYDFFDEIWDEYCKDCYAELDKNGRCYCRLDD